MAVVTREDVQALRDDIQALTVAQAQDRERVAKLEVQVDESDKRLATKEDVEKAISAVRSDIQSVQTELADVKSDMRWVKWFLGYGVTLGTGILLLLLRMAGWL